MKSQRFNDNVCMLVALIVTCIVAWPVVTWESARSVRLPVHIVRKLGTRVIGDFWLTNQETINFYRTNRDN